MKTTRQRTPDASGSCANPTTIEYSVRESARTRRVHLRIVPGRGLIVTIPRRYPHERLHAIIEARRDWIISSLADIDAAIPEVFRQWPPTALPLQACDRNVQLRFDPPLEDQPRAVQWLSNTMLRLHVDSASREQVAHCVAAALKPLARALLLPRLADLASTHGLSYQRVVVRGQRSIWGSYSSRGTVSLNYKLLFLETHLVDYVLLHELAHTRHLDHSPAFWSLLDTLSPGARALDRELASAGAQVPPWLELAR